MKTNRSATPNGYEFLLPDGCGGYICALDGDKIKPRFTTKERAGGNGFGISTRNVGFTCNTIDRHIVAVFRKRNPYASLRTRERKFG